MDLSRKARAQRSALRRIRARRAVSAIETAVTLPLLTFLTFGSLELANGIHLRQSMAIASYEGARSISGPGATEDQAKDRIRDILTARGVRTFSVAIEPKVLPMTPRGTMISVTVSTDSTSIQYAPFRLFSGKSISNSTVMVRQ